MKKAFFLPVVVATMLSSVSALTYAQSPRISSLTKAPSPVAPMAPVATSRPMTTPSPQPTSQIVIGSATENLLNFQRTMPSQKPRYIDGAQASRSYQRYLKSFESAIPEKYDTGVEMK